MLRGINCRNYCPPPSRCATTISAKESKSMSCRMLKAGSVPRIATTVLSHRSRRPPSTNIPCCRERLLEGAVKAKAAGAVRYCMVNSGRGPTQKEIEELAEVVQEIKSNVPINICCSVGLMNEAKARILKEAGVERVNHNLNTSRKYYSKICTTHTYDDRIATLKNVKSAGLSSCCGGIIGMGETDDDLMDMALALRDLYVDSIPINFL